MDGRRLRDFRRNYGKGGCVMAKEFLGELELNRIYQCDCIEGMRLLPDNSVDLTVTSPPYDDLRTYNGYSFDFKSTAQELYRITEDGGVVVWVVNDSTIKGGETGNSFRQALYFMDTGFLLFDTMIWKKTNPMPINDKRYQQCFEYMFVFSKHRPKTVNLIKVPKSEKTIYRQKFKMTTTQKGRDGRNVTPTIYDGKDRPDLTKRKNIWEYSVGFNAQNDKIASRHPAIFPERLAEDHIISWSNENDVILDPFMGSGTTAKMAALNNRKYIGFEISEEYVQIANQRLESVQDELAEAKLTEGNDA